MVFWYLLKSFQECRTHYLMKKLDSDWGESDPNSIFLSCPSWHHSSSFDLHAWGSTRHYQKPPCGQENDLQDTPNLLQPLWPSGRSSPSVFTCNPNPTHLQRQCISTKITEYSLGLKGNLICFQGDANEKKSVSPCLNLQILKDG